MRRYLTAACLLLLAICTEDAKAWGSMAAAFGNIGSLATHQYIDQQAFDEMLAKDPAFKPGRFPGANRIWYYGVIDTYQKGAGPDAAGLTPYSWHYYNPRISTAKGDGPETTAKFARELAQGLNGGVPTVYGKEAAWSSHFMADMYVPYHVIGFSNPELNKIYAAAGGTNCTAVSLDQTVTGDPAFLGSANEFKAIIELYMPNTSDPKINWFDPWYWDWMQNGFGRRKVMYCTHLWWEGTKVSHSPGTLTGFDPAYKNPPVPTSVTPQYTQHEAAIRKMAEEVATRTSNDITNRINNPQTCLTEAIIGTYTLWRSSFSALDPSIETTPGTTPEGKPCYDVKVIVKNLETREAATGVKVKVRLYAGGKMKPANEEKSIGTIGAQGSGDATGWQIETDDPKNGKLEVEVVGGFDKIPDLQYACIDTNLTPCDVSNSVVLVIDASGSMSGAKIGNAKSTAISQIDQLDETTEVAVFSFSGGSGSMIAPFHIPTAAGKASLKASIDSLSAGGNTPLAAAIRRAGIYMKGKARGKESRTLIILSDGEENCGGNPAAEIAALNDVIVIY